METPQINVTENDDDTLKYSSIHHPQYLMTRLDKLRSEGSTTDINLKVKDKLFSCHRLILIALSSYFEGMFRGSNFTESTTDTIELKDISPAAVNSLLNFMYTGSITISECIVSDVLFAANMWQMEDVIKSCHTFQKQLLERKPEKAVSILHQAILFDLTDLIIGSRKVICEHFGIVYRQPEFIRLSYKEFTSILGSKHLSAPKEIILKAVVKWFECNQETDQTDVNLLFSLIPLNFVNLECLRETYSNELWQRFPFNARYFKNVIEIVEQGLAMEQITGQNVERSTGNQVYILDSSDASKSLLKFNIQSGHCDRLADIPHKHKCFGSVFIRNKIFAIDDCDSCQVSKYDLNLNTWSSCRPLPSERLYSTVGVLNERIYVCGGRDDNCNVFNSVVKYNPETDNWSSVAKMRQKRIGACTAELNDFLYVIGGYNHTNRLSSCERYTVLTNRWESISPLPSPRSYAAAVSVNNSLYVLGGYVGSYEASSVFKYDLASRSWSSCAEMPYSGYNLSACAVGNKIFVSGGYCRDHLKKSAVFDVNLNSWTEGPELPHPISFHSTFPVI